MAPPVDGGTPTVTPCVGDGGDSPTVVPPSVWVGGWAGLLVAELVGHLERVLASLRRSVRLIEDHRNPRGFELTEEEVGRRPAHEVEPAPGLK